MKKRMLITSIVMVVVLAVALTTSSLAWFSAAQPTVSANDGTFTAETAGDSNVNIAIGTDLNSFKSSVSLAKILNTNTLSPAALRVTSDISGDDVAAKLKTLLSGSSLNFDTARIGGGYFKPDTHKTGSITLDPAAEGGKLTANNQESVSGIVYYDSLYLVNNDETFDVSSLKFILSGSLTKTDEDKSLAKTVAILRISRANSDATTWTYFTHNIFVIGGDGNTISVGDMSGVKGGTMYEDTTQVSRLISQVGADTKVNTTVNASNNLLSDFSSEWAVNFTTDNYFKAAQGEYLKIDVIMWFDGDELKSSTDGLKIDFNIKIEGATATTGA